MNNDNPSSNSITTMTNREFILDKLERKHIIQRFCKSGVFIYQLANDGHTVIKTRYCDSGKKSKKSIKLQTALKQLTDHLPDIIKC